MIESSNVNPFRKFLPPDAFSIQTSLAVDLQDLNAEPIQNKRASLPDTPSSNISSEEDHQPESEDDDMSSSSGCSSGSLTSDDDDIVSKTESETGDSGIGKMDFDASKFGDIVDDFEDDFPNTILDTLPDGLRQVMAEVREKTNSDIRQRNKKSRITMMLTEEENRIWRKAALRMKLLGAKTPPKQPPHPGVDLSKKFYPRMVKTSHREQRELFRQEQNSNVLVIDNTNVTLRKKGTSQINQDEENGSASGTFQPLSHGSDGEDDELTEFNTHNYWYISPEMDISMEISAMLDAQPKSQSPPKSQPEVQPQPPQPPQPQGNTENETRQKFPFFFFLNFQIYRGQRTGFSSVRCGRSATGCRRSGLCSPAEIGKVEIELHRPERRPENVVLQSADRSALFTRIFRFDGTLCRQ